MRCFDRHSLMTHVAQVMRVIARRAGTYDGLNTAENRELLHRCKAIHLPTGSILAFTRDEGMHSSGWWKNPDYERCFHLSISFRDPITGALAPKNSRITDDWLDAFYGDAQRYLWAEPPYTKEGKRADVWHYRVFCDPTWSPMLPRGEVYTKDFTERGWLSFSDLKNERHRALSQLEPQAGEL